MHSALRSNMKVSGSVAGFGFIRGQYRGRALQCSSAQRAENPMAACQRASITRASATVFAVQQTVARLPLLSWHLLALLAGLGEADGDGLFAAFHPAAFAAAPALRLAAFVTVHF